MPRRLFALLALLLAACGDDPERDPAIGEAFIAPETLEIRREIDPRAPAAATVKHGERVDIVQRRRGFFKVRSESGAEGWTHQRMLLNRAEMNALRNVEEIAEKLPPQGLATTLDLLNVHLEPYRQSPTVLQLKEGDKIEVLAHKVMPQIAPERPPLIPPPPPRPPKPVKKKPEPKYPPPPLPAAPDLPEDWLEISKTPSLPEEPEPEKPKKPAPAPAPPPMDDWSLVRTPAGLVGWVLTSRVFMLIPDEVAQYAEGRRITSYFSLGEVQDGEQKKHHWLWTTVNEGVQEHEFDSFRVFIWNIRRHRYETAYVERNRKGYFPVLVHPGGEYREFSLCLGQEDGTRVRRRYALMVNVVRFVEEKPCESWPYDQVLTVTGAVSEHTPDAAEPPDFTDRVTNTLKRWFRFR